VEDQRSQDLVVMQQVVPIDFSISNLQTRWLELFTKNLVPERSSFTKILLYILNSALLLQGVTRVHLVELMLITSFAKMLHGASLVTFKLVSIAFYAKLRELHLEEFVLFLVLVTNGMANA
jgi:hypothetical protein